MSIQHYNPFVSLVFGLFTIFAIIFLAALLFKHAPYFVIGIIASLYIFIIHHKDLFKKKIAYVLFLISIGIVFFYIVYFFGRYNLILGYVSAFFLFCLFCTISQSFDDNPYQHKDGQSEPLANEKENIPKFQKAEQIPMQQEQPKIEEQTEQDDDCETEYVDEEEKNHQENMLCYNLLWLAIITGFVARFFIKPQYSFSDTMFVCVWLIGFLFSAYSVFVTKQRFRDYNLLFVIIAPFAIIFWSELVFGFFDNKKYYSPKETAEMVSYIKQQEQKKHSNHLINTTIDEMNSKGVENFHKTQIFQNSVEATRQILGDNPSDAQITSHLENMASLMNGNLPIMVDEYTQMFKVTIIGKTVIYNYKVTNIENFVNIPNNAIQEHKNNMMNSNMCANMGYILEYGVKISYNYYAVNGDYLFTVDIAPSDCGY